MHIPATLRPSGTYPVRTSVHIPKATPTFRRWHGPSPGDAYGGKPIVDFRGHPAFAELAILWALRDAGWDGVWVDSFRRRYRRTYWEPEAPITLPKHAERLFQKIQRRAAPDGRCWDVFCWRRERVLFAEAKRASRDHMRRSQLKWLRAALDLRLPVSAFLIVEWRLE